MTNPWEERAESWSETTPLASREGGDAVSNENATNTTNQEANQYDVVANNGIVCEDDPSLRHGEKSCEWVGKNLSRCWNYVEEELVLYRYPLGEPTGKLWLPKRLLLQLCVNRPREGTSTQ